MSRPHDFTSKKSQRHNVLALLNHDNISRSYWSDKACLVPTCAHFLIPVSTVPHFFSKKITGHLFGSTVGNACYYTFDPPNKKSSGLVEVILQDVRRKSSFPVLFCQVFSKLQKKEPLPGWWFLATPLKNMSSSIGMMTFPIYGKIKLMFQTTNQLPMDLFLWPRADALRRVYSPSSSSAL